MTDDLSFEKLELLSQIAKTIRRHIITTTAAAGSGHPGGSLSAVEIITSLYFYKMRYRPEDPDWKDRDRFILSKGHAAPALYATLAEAGFFPVSYLRTLRQLGSSLQGHPDKISLPGIDMSTGSLGQGLSIANGIALAGRLDKINYHVYVLMGDGEIQEGMIWEAAMTSAHHHLDNLTGILDFNKQQIDGDIKQIKTLDPLPEKWKAFGWQVLEIDGHNFPEIIQALNEAEKIKGQPTLIIAHTIKGKGVSFMEGNLKFHGTAPTKEEANLALKELE